jgi:hypothetical protein
MLPVRLAALTMQAMLTQLAMPIRQMTKARRAMLIHLVMPPRLPMLARLRSQKERKSRNRHYSHINFMQ